MRPPTLQYFYLQKPLTLILIIAGLALLPWLGLDRGGDSAFSRFHAIIAYAEALIFIGASFVFLGRRLKLPEVFTASLIQITAFATQSYFLCDAVEMLFSLLLLITIIFLFKWEEANWEKFPWMGVISLSLASVIKGGYIIVMVLIIFGSYILLRHHTAKTIIKKTALFGILSAIIPVVAFFFLKPEWLHFITTSESSEGPLYFYLISLMCGLFPWMVYILFSIFGISPSATERRRKKENRPVGITTETEQRVYLYSMVVIVLALVGFSAVTDKKTANICLLYPFASLFIARYATFLTEYRTRVTRIFGTVLLLVSIAFSAIFVGASFGVLNVSELAWSGTNNLGLIAVAEWLQKSFSTPSLLNWALFSVLLFAQATMIYQLGKKVNIKILYSCIGLYLALAIFLNLVVFLQL